MAGDAGTGVSIMRMDAGLDTGPVYLTRETPIGRDDTSGTLHDRLSGLGADALFFDALDGIFDGSLTPHAQPDEGVPLCRQGRQGGAPHRLVGRCGRDRAPAARVQPVAGRVDHPRRRAAQDLARDAGRSATAARRGPSCALMRVRIEALRARRVAPGRGAAFGPARDGRQRILNARPVAAGTVPGEHVRTRHRGAGRAGAVRARALAAGTVHACIHGGDSLDRALARHEGALPDPGGPWLPARARVGTLLCIAARRRSSTSCSTVR